MICEKCKNVEKTWDTDKYRNVIIRWECHEYCFAVYTQVVYNGEFRDRLLSGKWDKHDEYILSLIPKDKKISELGKIEVLFRRKIDRCKDFKETLKPLERFL